MTSYTCTATNITSDFVNTIGVAAETAAGDELEEEDMTNVVVMLPCPTIMVATSGIDVTCNGAADGSAMAIPSGGAEPYTFLWSNGAITSDISNLDTGNYVVIATDLNGCTGTGTVLINEPPALIVETVATNVTCNGGMDGMITVTASGGASGSVSYTHLTLPTICSV